MARAYTVTAVAVTLRVPTKWVDNVLSHHAVPGVVQARQGVTRRLSPRAVAILELTLRLNRALGMPTEKALQLAQQCVESGESDYRLFLTDSVRLLIDLDRLTADVQLRLAEAVEMAPSPRRGRPPR